MRVLLHICCAPCALECRDWLVGYGYEVTGLFFNPNIHPLIEFRRRLKSLKVLQERVPFDVIYEEEYGLLDFLRNVAWDAESRASRCRACYAQRLDRTALAASERGMGAFTTTMLSSTHQDHEMLNALGEESARRHGVDWLSVDWRPLAHASHERARKMHLYLQQYCGCIFSERERFEGTSLHVYRGRDRATSDESPDRDD